MPGPSLESKKTSPDSEHLLQLAPPPWRSSALRTKRHCRAKFAPLAGEDAGQMLARALQRGCAHTAPSWHARCNRVRAQKTSSSASFTCRPLRRCRSRNCLPARCLPNHADQILLQGWTCRGARLEVRVSKCPACNARCCRCTGVAVALFHLRDLLPIWPWGPAPNQQKITVTPTGREATSAIFLGPGRRRGRVLRLSWRMQMAQGRAKGGRRRRT